MSNMAVWSRGTMNDNCKATSTTIYWDRGKSMRHVSWLVFLTFFCWTWTWGQTLSDRSAQTPPPSADSAVSKAPSDNIALTVPAGTPLKVALDQEVRIRE